MTKFAFATYSDGKLSVDILRHLRVDPAVHPSRRDGGEKVNALNGYTEEELAELRAVARAAGLAQGASDLADDVASEALARLAAYEKPVAYPKAFLRLIAKNVAIDWWKDQPPDGWGDMPPSDPRAGQRGYRREDWISSPSAQVRRTDALARVFELLKPVERDLLLGQAEGLSIEELAARHNYTPKSVKTILSAARRAIRQHFSDDERRDLLEL